jgi:hypothetical protein
MKIIKGTPCFLSIAGYYNIVYMTDDIAEINCDCEVVPLSYLSPGKPDYVAVRTKSKNIGRYENESDDPHDIVVWIRK